jgi:hypothetical protein
MILNNSDVFRENYKIYLEPCLATGAENMALKIGCKTRSKYVRYSLINQLIRDGFKLSEKFEPFKIKLLDKGLTHKA